MTLLLKMEMDPYLPGGGGLSVSPVWKLFLCISSDVPVVYAYCL